MFNKYVGCVSDSTPESFRCVTTIEVFPEIQPDSSICQIYENLHYF